MLQRLAFMQLQNALREGSVADREQWRTGLEKLGFKDTLLDPSSQPPLVVQGFGDLFVDALNRLSAPSVAGSPIDEVAPIEKLDLLIRLASRAGSLSKRVSVEKDAINALAGSLLKPKYRADPKQVTKLLVAIDRAGKARKQVIRIQDLEDMTQFDRITGPKPPRAARRRSLETVADTLGLARNDRRLVKGLANHPVVVVDTCIYKALIGDQAEYPVHLRTTISFNTKATTVAKFKHLFDPKRWPDFNPFWLGMTHVPPPQPQADVPVPLGDAPVAEPTPEEEASIKTDPYIAHVHTIGWESVGTFHEQVGFDGPSPPLGGIPGVKDERGLYKDTYLYFSRTKDITKRPVLTYTLLRREPPLRIDDGCIEIKRTDTGVDVITTKSLYVDGVGTDTELAGILAYMAAYSGWGTNTLLLVSNAAQNN